MNHINGRKFHSIEGVAAVCTHDLENYLKAKEVSPVIVAHNSDGCILDHPARDCDFHFDAEKIPQHVKRIYCQNCDVDHPKLTPIPIGLENEHWDAQKVPLLQKAINKNWQKSGLCLICHETSTNPGEREELYEMFEGENGESNASWMTIRRGKNGDSFEKYINQIAQHRFMVCPEGNGLSTHRFWESLYVGTIPIVKKRVFTEAFSKLFPMVIVSEWSQLSYQFLEKEMVRLRGMEYSRFLDFSWWKTLIQKGHPLDNS